MKTSAHGLYSQSIGTYYGLDVMLIPRRTIKEKMRTIIDVPCVLKILAVRQGTARFGRTWAMGKT